MTPSLRHLVPLATALALVACATPPDRTAIDRARTAVPAAWNAPLPHGGSRTELARWWEGFDDPQVPRLVAAADAASPNVAAAAAPITRNPAAWVKSPRMVERKTRQPA